MRGDLSPGMLGSGVAGPYPRRMQPLLVHVPTLAEEVAPYRELSEAQRGAMLRAVCRAGARMALARPDAAAVLAYRDPVSPDTEAQLARLVREFRRT